MIFFFSPISRDVLAGFETYLTACSTFFGSEPLRDFPSPLLAPGQISESWLCHLSSRKAMERPCLQLALSRPLWQHS